MLQKSIDRLNNPLKKYLNKKITLHENELQGYTGAFLAAVRNKLKGKYHKNEYPSIGKVFNIAERDLIYKEIYK